MLQSLLSDISNKKDPWLRLGVFWRLRGGWGYGRPMGIFSRKSKTQTAFSKPATPAPAKPEVKRLTTGLADELALRLNSGYRIVQETPLEAYIVHPGGDARLLFEKPDKTVGVYSVDSNPFTENGGILDKMKKKWRGIDF